MKIIVLSLALLGLAASPGGGAEGSGHLVIIGGGPRPSFLIDSIVELAGGREGRLVIIPIASAEPVETAEYQQEQFEQAGIGDVEVLIFDRETVDAPAHLAAIDRATGVFFSGGDQRRLTDVMTDSRLLARIRQLYTRGGLVAGTSAGAAVMSGVMITGDERLNDDPDRAFETIVAENIETEPGFGFLPGSIVDQHFVARRRHNRLISLVLEHPDLLGIGIDESTAVVVGPPDRFEVVGESQVVVYDASRATGLDRGVNGTLGGSNLRLHVLNPGRRFDLHERTPIP